MELQELPPGGREVRVLPPLPVLSSRVLLGFSPQGCLEPVRGEGGWVDGQQLLSWLGAALPALSILIRNWQWQPQLRQAAPAPGRICRRCPWPLSRASCWEKRQRELLQPFSGLPLSFSLSLLSLSVFKSHYMGFCSFGTPSSFPICPGTYGAVTGMLRTQSVGCRGCTNERIQALLVSGGGTSPSPSAPAPPPLQSPSGRPVSLAWGAILYQVGVLFPAHPVSVPLAAVSSDSIFRGRGCGSWVLAPVELYAGRFLCHHLCTCRGLGCGSSLFTFEGHPGAGRHPPGHL